MDCVSNIVSLLVVARLHGTNSSARSTATLRRVEIDLTLHTSGGAAQGDGEVNALRRHVQAGASDLASSGRIGTTALTAVGRIAVGHNDPITLVIPNGNIAALVDVGKIQ